MNRLSTFPSMHRMLRPAILFAVLAIAGSLAQGASIGFAPSHTCGNHYCEPVVVGDGEATSQRVFQVVATEKTEKVDQVEITSAQVFVYPLLHDSPEPPAPGSGLGDRWGTLIEGKYTLRMRVRLLEAPGNLRINFLQKSSPQHVSFLRDVPIGILDPSRWYQIEGALEVTGPDL